MTQANEHDYTGDQVDAGLASALRISVTRLARRLRAERAAHGAPGLSELSDTQLGALATLERHGAMTPGELAEHEKVQPPSMTRVIAVLEQRSLVTRTAHATDKRQVMLTATAEGKELGAPVPQAQGRLAGETAEGAHTGGPGEAARSSADTGEAQSVVTRLLRRTFGSLRTRNYRLFATGQVISNTGTWMQRVAQDWLVLDLTHGSGSALGITTGLQFLPLLLFSLWGGMIADRYPKRRVLMATQSAMGGLALILGMLALTHTVVIWDVYALSFGLGLATAADNPTRQAFAAEMVGRGGMANAIALNSAVFNLARIAGPAVAGLVISVLGTPAAFLVNAASYGAVLISLQLMRPSELHVVERLPRAKGQLREAMRYVTARPALWLPLVLVFFVATFGMNIQVTNALMSRDVFHTGAGAFGLASAVYAAGALGGALLAARRGRPTTGLLVTTALAFSLLEVVSAAMPAYWLFLVLLVPTGLALLTFTTAANSATQLGTSADMRGRVMGLYMLVFMGGAPLGSPLAGWVAEVFGPRMCLVAGGAISGVATVVIGAVLARAKGVRVREYLRPARQAA